MVVNWVTAFSIGPGVYVIWCTIQPLDDWTEYTRSDDTESVGRSTQISDKKLSQLKKLEKCHWSWKEWSVVWIPALLLTAVWPRPSSDFQFLTSWVCVKLESEIINVTAHCKFFIRYHHFLEGDTPGSCNILSKLTGNLLLFQFLTLRAGLSKPICLQGSDVGLGKSACVHCRGPL